MGQLLHHKQASADDQQERSCWNQGNARTRISAFGMKPPEKESAGKQKACACQAA